MDPNVTPQVGDALRTTVDMVLHFGADFFAFIVLTGIVVAFAFYFGRDRLVPLIAGVYAAVPLYTYFPFMQSLGSNPYAHLGLFLLFTVVAMMAFFGLASWVSSTGVGFIKVVGLSALTAGLILGVGINLLPLQEVYTVSEPTRVLFSTPYLFYWLLAGVAGTFLLGR